MSDFEFEIAELKKKIEELEEKKGKIPSYQYSKIRDTDLRKLFSIKKNLKRNIFETWFNKNIILSHEINDFLNKLMKENETLIQSYKEEDLKMYFIGPLLNKVNFKLIKNEIRGFYEESLTYRTDEFILNGTTDFIVSKGLIYSEMPYFFIQEFKKNRVNSDPEPQLIAELISAVELNDWKSIKGAYIVGENWNFVILHRLEKHKYEYFVSRTFNSTNIEDLKGIFRNLLFVKQEIIEMVKEDR